LAVARKLASKGLEASFTIPKSFKDIVSSIKTSAGADRISQYYQKLEKVAAKDKNSAQKYIRQLAERMIRVDASDMDMGGPAGKEHVWYRTKGFKRPVEEVGLLPIEISDLLILNLLSPSQVDILLKNRAVDFGYGIESADAEGGQRRYRCTAYFDLNHLALTFRLLAEKPFDLDLLGFNPVLKQQFMFRNFRDGLILFTGVTGSGKSTTLDAIVDANNRDIEAHVLIIAQPLEFIHRSKKGLVRHREVGIDVPSYTAGMVQSLRQDPDIVVVGEMRDAESINTAMEVSDTGHLVFSTLHTGSVMETIDRIMATYPPGEQERVRHRLADVLRCVVSQKLLPKVRGGRVMAKEALVMTPPARAAIKNGHVSELYQMMWEGSRMGMTTLEQDLAVLVKTGEVEVNTALSYANNKKRLTQLIR